MTRFALALMLMRMCGDDDEPAAPALDAGVVGADGGSAERDDAAIDGGSTSEPPSFPLAPGSGAEDPGEARDNGVAGDLDTCYDGIDNDGESGNPGADCDDPACSALPSCWIGRATRCVPVDAGPSFTGCASGACLEGATLFGSPTPFVDGDALALGGDADYDSGALYPTSHDLRTDALRLTATFGLPEACTGCLESAAVGLTAASSIGDADHVTPVVALVLSGARGELAFVVGDLVLARFPASPGPWTLELLPTGVARVLEGTTVRHAGARFARVQSARAVLYGHSRNPSATEVASARIVSFTATAERCDIPSAWSSPESLRFERGVERWSVDNPSSPSVALDPAGVPTLVFLREGALFASKAPDPADPARFIPIAPSGFDDTPLLDDLREVDLISTDEGFELLAVRDDDQGSRLDLYTLSADTTELGPAAPLSVDLGAGLTGVALARRGDDRFLVTTGTEGARAHVATAGSLALHFVARLPTETLEADAFGSPDLFVLRDTYRVVVPVRRGTRWRTALFASDDFVRWRLVDAASADALDEAERLGLRNVDALVEPGRESWVYRSDDGVRALLRRRERSTP